MLFQETSVQSLWGNLSVMSIFLNIQPVRNNYFQIASIVDVGSEPRTSLPLLILFKDNVFQMTV